MSENEKLTAQMPESAAENAQTEELELKTPQESNPLENASNEAVVEEEKEITKENPQAEAEEEKEKETLKEVHKSKKIGAVIAASLVCVLSVGAIAALGVAGRGGQTVSTADEAEDKAEAAVTTDAGNGLSKEDLQVAGSMSWWMAGVDQYNFIFDDEIDGTSATTTTVPETTTAQPETTVPTTTTAPETTTTPAATITEKPTTTTVLTTTAPKPTTTVTTTEKKPEYTEKEIEKTTFYLTANVNLRKGPGTGYAKIVTLKKGTAVTATVKVSNGWYKVTADGKTGYIIDDYLTKTKPAAVTTTTVTTTAKPAETAKPSEDKTEAAKTPVVSYTDEELQMFYYVVEGEVGGCSETSKLAVANVIINRVKDSRFPNTLKGVMTAKSQFTAIRNYYNKTRKPTQSTIDCVNRALYGEDNSKGALYFYSKKYCSGSTVAWFESLTFCLEVDGQRYFK